jgi:transcriptional regulator with XRE-family HTH domain
MPKRRTFNRHRQRKPLAARLKAARIASGLTIVHVAEVLGIDRMIWSRVEKGTASVPAERLREIGHMFRIDPGSLIG